MSVGRAGIHVIISDYVVDQGELDVLRKLTLAFDEFYFDVFWFLLENICFYIGATRYTCCLFLQLSLRDIQSALTLTAASSSLKKKLMLRRAKCLFHLKDSNSFSEGKV